MVINGLVGRFVCEALIGNYLEMVSEYLSIQLELTFISLPDILTSLITS